LHPAVAGAVAASVWGRLEAVDQRLFGCDYSDVAVLGKAVTEGTVGAWPASSSESHRAAA
jgi:hypothetical protein